MSDADARQLVERGLELHRSGRRAEAEQHYRRALAVAPNDPDALHLLGLVAHQDGRPAEALELIDRASTAEPTRAAYHKHAALALLALGRVAASAARLRRAVRLRPEDPEAHNHLGTALQQLGKSEEAFASYQAALRLAPGYAAPALNLGNVLAEEGRWDEALGCYLRARSLEATPQFRLAFGSALRGARFDAQSGQPGGVAADPALAELVLRALTDPWARPADLSRGCVRLLMTRPVIRHAVERANAAWPQRLAPFALFGGDGVAALATDPLLIALLECAPVADAGLERMLTSVRRSFLDHACAEVDVLTHAGATADAGATRGAAAGAGSAAAGAGMAAAGAGMAAAGAGSAAVATISFRCSLARQCFLNDYVFDAAGDEVARASQLGDVISSRLDTGGVVPPAWLAALGAYLPLGSIRFADRLAAIAWPAPVEALLRVHVIEPRDERGFVDSLPRLTPVDPESSVVRAQYEEHPYPGWTHVAPPPPRSAATPSDVSMPLEPASPLEILIAGCGTGQESIEVALVHPDARVLAVDLSLASLAYAERKAREMGIGNLTHAQADILHLAELGRSFDAIYAVGVLHHLAQPIEGLRVLASMLRPGGSMLIGLYSERARRDIVAAREHIASSGYRAVTGDIRRCRQELMSFGSDTPLGRVALLRDFHTTSECRDLLFHVEEHRYVLPQVGALLDDVGLRVVALAAGSRGRSEYSHHFPEDTEMTDLSRWDEIEAQHPDTFVGMYLLWVSRDPAPR